MISDASTRRSSIPVSVPKRTHIALVTLVLFGGCAGTGEVSASQRALIGCYHDHGIDARPLQGGAVHFDREGSLTREESFELAETCTARVEAMGLFRNDEPTSEELLSRYAALDEIRECLLKLGFAIPDLVDLDEFVNDPAVQAHPYAYLEVGSGDLEWVYSTCPDALTVRINP